MGEKASHPPTSSEYFSEGAGHTNVPVLYDGNQVQAYINGPDYFEALVEDIQRLGRADAPDGNQGQYLYISSYVLNWLQPDYHFRVLVDGRPVRFIDLVLEKARAGVDVRILVWGPWNLALVDKVDLRPEPGDNMRTIAALRQDPAMQGKACLNILSHPAGSAHTKMVVLGGPEWAVGYTGGIDLSPDRAEPRWLDVQARLEGPVVQELYDFYREMWNQNMVFSGLDAAGLSANENGNGNGRRSMNGHNGKNGHHPSVEEVAPDGFSWQRAWKDRASQVDTWLRASRPTYFRGRGGEMSSVEPGTPPVPALRLPVRKPGLLLVQSLRTVPAFKFAFSPLAPRIRVAPLAFAPHGAFEVRDALRQAVAAARRYIYLEDQYFWSVEAMGWIREALLKNPSLRVVFATGESDQIRDRLKAYRAQAVLDGLLQDLPPASWKQLMFIKRDELVHAKTVLIDDQWALIGSANIANRSYYTDIEHSVAIGDPGGGWVRAYRAALWSSRLGLPAPAAASLLDLERGLQVWESAAESANNSGANSSGANGSGADGGSANGIGANTGGAGRHAYPDSLRRIFDALPDRPSIDMEWYRMVEDPDSRQPWYFPLRRSYARYMEV